MSVKRSCIFCDKTNLTREHLLPKWIQNYFGPKTVGLNVITKSDGSSYQFTEKAFNHTARIVCEDCNSGWMSQLEGEVQKILGPMFTGQNGSVSLAHYDRSVIAHWVAKTLSVLEFANNEETTHMPRSVPETLYKTHTLLAEHTIYIGFRNEANGEDGRHVAGFLVQTPTDLKVKPEHAETMKKAHANHAKIFSASLVVGHAYFYMTGTDIPNGYAFVYPYMPQHLTQIWPEDTNEDISWPVTHPIEGMGNWDGMNTYLNKHLAIDFHKAKS